MPLLSGFNGSRRSEALVYTHVKGTVPGEAADHDAQHEESNREVPRGLLEEVGGALHSADLAGALESGGESSSFGVLDQNHCPQEEADNQNDDGQKGDHVQMFKSYAAFSAGPQNKHFFLGISKREACKLSWRGSFGPVGRIVSPWFR